MSWGTKRRNSILLIIVIIILIPITIWTLDFLINPATCFDNKHNGDESGIDCGGSCALLCQTQIIEPIVRWQRSFEVSPGIYNVVAYLENPNPDSGVANAPYVFKLFDKENILLYERKGSVSIGPKEIIPIVENTLFTDKLQPSRVTFEFTEDLIFTKQNPREPVLSIKNEDLLNVEKEPRVVASIKNSSIFTVKDVTVVVIVYDQKDNAIASSSTIIDQIGKDQELPIVFTWPVSFSGAVSRIEIIPLYDSPKN